ncbi:MAG TPA: cysteine desulfurase [Vicinamibacteria bacterium]|nr:cysteine desulfurase [Vicinamibacteria bacterium]
MSVLETGRQKDALDVAQVRADFPILAAKAHGKPLVFLDSAASAQKPRAVIEAEARMYAESYANVHRGVYELSVKATDAYEGARATVQRFLNAASTREIVFVRGTTEAVNLVAGSYGRKHVGAGDEVLITGLEHHSNIVPWQLLCEATGARLRVVPITDAGEVPLDEVERLISARTRIVSVAHVSNALGTLLPVKEIVRVAHGRGVPVFVDGAQSAPRLPIDVREIGCDFFAFSGHKAYGPSGIGALYARAEHLEAMPPWQGGGDMIASVSFERTTYNEIPYKFEAGTPNIAGAVGLGAALDYLTGLGLERVAAHEDDLLRYGTDALSAIPGLTLVGTARHKAGVLSFVLDGVHPHDIGTVLDYEGIAIRTGHHCAQPVMDRFGLPATARASLGVYNTREDIDALAAGIRKVQEMFR